jgi:hypothetical protein
MTRREKQDFVQHRFDYLPPSEQQEQESSSQPRDQHNVIMDRTEKKNAQRTTTTLVFDWGRAHRLLQSATVRPEEIEVVAVLEATTTMSSSSSYSDHQECAYSNDDERVKYAVERHEEDDGVTGDEILDDLLESSNKQRIGYGDSPIARLRQLAANTTKRVGSAHEENQNHMDRMRLPSNNHMERMRLPSKRRSNDGVVATENNNNNKDKKRIDISLIGSSLLQLASSKRRPPLQESNPNNKSNLCC